MGQPYESESGLIPMTTYLAVIASALFGGIGSAFFSSWLSRRKDQTQLMREKAEQLYMAADEWCRDLGIYHFSFLPMLDCTIDYNQMLDMQKANATKKKHGGLETVQMLVRLYYPEVRPQLEALIGAQATFNEIQHAHKAEYKVIGPLGPEWKSRFMLAMHRANQTGEALTVAILDAADKYAAPSRHDRFPPFGWLKLRPIAGSPSPAKS